ncbi:MAG: hypothetical protein IJD48_04520 [Clostridia bacterium]|nr:hypothetical protein [Clostridia bacterium]
MFKYVPCIKNITERAIKIAQTILYAFLGKNNTEKKKTVLRIKKKSNKLGKKSIKLKINSVELFAKISKGTLIVIKNGRAIDINKVGKILFLIDGFSVEVDKAKLLFVGKYFILTLYKLKCCIL